MTWDRIQDLVEQLEEIALESGLSYVLAIAQPDGEHLNHLCKSYVQVESGNALFDLDAELEDTMCRAFSFNDKITRATYSMDDEDDDDDNEGEGWRGDVLT